jgi:hypothetical protein
LETLKKVTEEIRRTETLHQNVGNKILKLDISEHANFTALFSSNTGSKFGTYENWKIWLIRFVRSINISNNHEVI